MHVCAHMYMCELALRWKLEKLYIYEDVVLIKLTTLFLAETDAWYLGMMQSQIRYQFQLPPYPDPLRTMLYKAGVIPGLFSDKFNRHQHLQRSLMHSNMSFWVRPDCIWEVFLKIQCYEFPLPKYSAKICFINWFD